MDGEILSIEDYAEQTGQGTMLDVDGVSVAELDSDQGCWPSPLTICALSRTGEVDPERLSYAIFLHQVSCDAVSLVQHWDMPDV